MMYSAGEYNFSKEMSEARFPNIFLDTDIWVLILRSTKNSATSCKNLWELFEAQYFGKSGLQIGCLNLVLELALSQ